MCQVNEVISKHYHQPTKLSCGHMQSASSIWHSINRIIPNVFNVMFVNNHSILIPLLNCLYFYLSYNPIILYTIIHLVHCGIYHTPPNKRTISLATVRSRAVLTFAKQQYNYRLHIF